MDPTTTRPRLIILADLGTLRVLEVVPAGDDPREREHLREIRKRPLKSPIQSPGEATTDTSGKFGRGHSAAVPNAMAHAENPNLDGELEKRTIEGLAGEIDDAVKAADPIDFRLAAPREHLNRLLDALRPEVRLQVSESYGINLVKAPLTDLEERFL